MIRHSNAQTLPKCSPPSDDILEQAARAFRDLRANCFWSSPASWVPQSAADVLFVIEGLEANGGRTGFLLGRALRAKLSADHASH